MAKTRSKKVAESKPTPVPVAERPAKRPRVSARAKASKSAPSNDVAPSTSTQPIEILPANDQGVTEVAGVEQVVEIEEDVSQMATEQPRASDMYLDTVSSLNDHSAIVLIDCSKYDRSTGLLSISISKKFALFRS